MFGYIYLLLQAAQIQENGSEADEVAEQLVSFYAL